MNARCNSHPIWPAACAALTAALVLTAAQPAAAQPGWVLSHQKISDIEGGFTGTLDDWDQFGTSLASLGDLDGDGVGDLAVGTWMDDDGGYNHGAVWALFLDGVRSGDLNGDGCVNQQDLGILLAYFGWSDGGDCDNDGDTDQSDLGILLAHWGEDCN